MPSSDVRCYKTAVVETAANDAGPNSNTCDLITETFSTPMIDKYL